MIIARTVEEVREAVAAALGRLLAHPDFTNVLPGLLAEPERMALVIDRLKALSQ